LCTSSYTLTLNSLHTPFAEAAERLRFRSSLRTWPMHVKVELPHTEYDDLASRMPGMIRQALVRAVQQRAAARESAAPAAQPQRQQLDTAPAAGSAAVAAAAAAADPQLLHYTHFPGCLAAELEYVDQQLQPPTDSELAAQLQQLLPANMRLLHLTSQNSADSAAGVWPDPLVLPVSDASCSMDVVVPAAVLRRLPAAAAAAQQQVRVVLAAADEAGVLFDGLVALAAPEEAGSSGRLQVGIARACC